MEYANTRMNLQLISEELYNLLFHYHIGGDDPDTQTVNFNPEVMTVIEHAHNHMESACVYLKRLDALFSGVDSDETFLSRLKDEMEKINPHASFHVDVERANERVVREVLEAEIAHLKSENERLEALVGLLDEVPMAHPKIA